MTDPIADMLTRLRNASMAGKRDVIIPFSRMKYTIAQILVKEGWVASVEKEERVPFSVLKVSLKYNKIGKSHVQVLQRISKPGRRVYVGKGEIPVVLNNFGLAILSTSKGVITSKEARRQGVGGEVLCEIA